MLSHLVSFIRKHLLAMVIIILTIALVGVSIANANASTPVGAEPANNNNEAATADAINDLTVEKISPEELEQLTANKYKDISWVFLDSSLSPHDRARTEKTGFSDALTYGFTASDNAGKFRELQEEILRNPVYGVTVVNAIRGKKLGDKTVEFYNPWMKEMVDLNNQYGVAYWLEKDSRGDFYVTTEYRLYAATLCTWLERLVDLGVQARTTVENWCLNAAALNNDRKGELATYQYTKEALVLAYVGKDVKVSYKDGKAVVDAQDAEAKSLMLIGINIHDKRPEFYGNPEDPAKTTYTPSKSNTGGNTPTPTPPTPNPPTPNPPTPDPPTPTPTYNKDPNKTPADPNDNQGPGTDTNNGVGATESTKDLPTNSNHMDSYEEYQKTVENLEEVNRTQKTGTEPSTPSYTPPAETYGNNVTVDNTGDTGTPTAAPINNPTHVSQPSIVAETGEQIDSTSGEPWGRPAD